MDAVAYLHVEAMLDLERDKRLLKETAEKVATIARAKAPGGLTATNGGKLGLHVFQFLELRPAAQARAMITVSALPLGPSLIQRAIDLKMPKLAGYRELRAAEYWLLVVGGRLPLSGYVTTADAQAGAFESPFDRTVFLDASDGGCVVIKTMQPQFTPSDDDGSTKDDDD